MVIGVENYDKKNSMAGRKAIPLIFFLSKYGWAARGIRVFLICVLLISCMTG
jgi:hypothetical protein